MTLLTAPIVSSKPYLKGGVDCISMYITSTKFQTLQTLRMNENRNKEKSVGDRHGRFICHTSYTHLKAPVHTMSLTWMNEGEPEQYRSKSAEREHKSIITGMFLSFTNHIQLHKTDVDKWNPKMRTMHPA